MITNQSGNRNEPAPTARLIPAQPGLPGRTAPQTRHRGQTPALSPSSHTARAEPAGPLRCQRSQELPGCPGPAPHGRRHHSQAPAPPLPPRTRGPGLLSAPRRPTPRRAARPPLPDLRTDSTAAPIGRAGAGRLCGARRLAQRGRPTAARSRARPWRCQWLLLPRSSDGPEPGRTAGSPGAGTGGRGAIVPHSSAGRAGGSSAFERAGSGGGTCARRFALRPSLLPAPARRPPRGSLRAPSSPPRHRLPEDSPPPLPPPTRAGKWTRSEPPTGDPGECPGRARCSSSSRRGTTPPPPPGIGVSRARGPPCAGTGRKSPGCFTLGSRSGRALFGSGSAPARGEAGARPLPRPGRGEPIARGPSGQDTPPEPPPRPWGARAGGNAGASPRGAAGRAPEGRGGRAPGGLRGGGRRWCRATCGGTFPEMVSGGGGSRSGRGSAGPGPPRRACCAVWVPAPAAAGGPRPFSHWSPPATPPPPPRSGAGARAASAPALPGRGLAGKCWQFGANGGKHHCVRAWGSGEVGFAPHGARSGVQGRLGGGGPSGLSLSPQRWLWVATVRVLRLFRAGGG